MPVWDDALNFSVENRAKAYLDANCAHCHSAQGSAKNSGLYLNYHQKDRRKRGILKPPIAAGKGSGDFKYDIVPGHPEESIFIYRVGSNDPAIPYARDRALYCSSKKALPCLPNTSKNCKKKID